MNISIISLCHNFDDLQTLLARINKVQHNWHNKNCVKKNSWRNINLNGYIKMIEHMTYTNTLVYIFQTEVKRTVVELFFIYIENSMNYTIRGDLKIYKKGNLSPFL